MLSAHQSLPLQFLNPLLYVSQVWQRSPGLKGIQISESFIEITLVNSNEFPFKSKLSKTTITPLFWQWSPSALAATQHTCWGVLPLLWGALWGTLGCCKGARWATRQAQIHGKAHRLVFPVQRTNCPVSPNTEFPTLGAQGVMNGGLAVVCHLLSPYSLKYTLQFSKLRWNFSAVWNGIDSTSKAMWQSRGTVVHKGSAKSQVVRW